jgi:hypothetical protein
LRHDARIALVQQLAAALYWLHPRSTCSTGNCPERAKRFATTWSSPAQPRPTMPGLSCLSRRRYTPPASGSPWCKCSTNAGDSPPESKNFSTQGESL